MEPTVRSARRSVAIAVLLAALAGCSSSTGGEAALPADGAPTPGTAEPSRTQVSPGDDGPPDDPLLAFTGRQLGGGTFDGSTVTGDVIVWFWTPW